MNDARPNNSTNGAQPPTGPELPKSIDPDDPERCRRYRLTLQYSIEMFDSESQAIPPDDATL